MKHYRITVTDGLVVVADTFVASDNRGVKGQAVPPHVTEYAEQYAKGLGETGYLTVCVSKYVAPVLSSSGVVSGENSIVWSTEFHIDAPANVVDPTPWGEM